MCLKRKFPYKLPTKSVKSFRPKNFKIKINKGYLKWLGCSSAGHWGLDEMSWSESEWKSLSCVRLMDYTRNSPDQNTGVGSLSLLHGIFPIQGSNTDPLPLSHKGSPRILEWVSYPFSRVSFRFRNRTRVSCIAGRFFTSWATREAPAGLKTSLNFRQCWHSWDSPVGTFQT